MRRLIVGLVVLLLGGAFGKPFFGGAATPIYSGPCDAITSGCTIAYSIDRAMTNAYSGPLFQLALKASPGTVLDIGQNTMTRAADMTTWSAFCGGVQSNCVYRKIYEQIVGSANDLIPTVFNTTFGPNCSGGTAITCAADFAIDGTSGLPTMTVGTGTNGASTPSPEYSIAGDAAATGIGSGTGKMTVFLIGKNIQQSGACCGSFGRSHAYNAGNAQGTDYILMMPYGTGIPNGATCPGGSTTFCIGVDEESQGQIADLPGQPSAPYNVPVNVIAMVNIDPAGAVEKAYLNGNQIYSHTGNPPLNVPGSIHLGGGGDLSQPGQITFRDGALITGTAMSGADFTALTNNTRAFYSGLSFP